MPHRDICKKMKQVCDIGGVKKIRTIRKFFWQLYAVVVVTSVDSCLHGDAKLIIIFLMIAIWLYINSSFYNFFTSLLVAFLPARVWTAMAVPVTQTPGSFCSISNSSDSELTIPMPPQHIAFDYSCVCRAGFTQAQHLTCHKTDCLTSKEIKQQVFEKGQKLKPKPPAKRKHTESTRGNVSSSHCHSLSVASSKSWMSVDAGNSMMFKWAGGWMRYIVFQLIENFLQMYNLLYKGQWFRPPWGIKPSKGTQTPTEKCCTALKNASWGARPHWCEVRTSVSCITCSKYYFISPKTSAHHLKLVWSILPVHKQPFTYTQEDISLPDMVVDHASNKMNSGKLEKSVLEMISPYLNVSAFWFENWFWNGSYKKLKDKQDKLIDMVLAPDFDVEDLWGVNCNKINAELAKDLEGTGESGNSWSTSTLTIKVPVATKITKASCRKKTNADHVAQVHDKVDTNDETPYHLYT